MRIFWRVAVLLVLIAAIVGIGIYAYNVGMAQGLAQKVQGQSGGAVPVPAPYYPYWPHFGMGFGFLGCIIPFFLLFLILGSVRALFWHGPMGWRRHMHHGPWRWNEEGGKGVPPFFEEWHKRAHGETPTDEPKQ